MNFIKVKHLVIALGAIAFISTSAVAKGEWKRSVEAGYNQTSGNTDKAQLSASGSIMKEMTDAEFKSTFNIYYSESDGQMDSQNWLSFTRYAFDFGDSKKWFNSYSLQVDHDRFADIDYRVLPAVGLGYWLFREDDFKWSVEGSLGYEITKYRSSKPDDESAVAIGRTYLEKKVFDNAKISEDFSVIPSLENEGTRIKSETAFTNPLTEGLDLSVKYIVDYDSEPSPGKKKTDTKIITGIKYSF